MTTPRNELWNAVTAFDEAWMEHINGLHLPRDVRVKHEALGAAIATLMAHADGMERHMKMLTAMLNAAITHGIEVVDVPQHAELDFASPTVNGH